MNLHIIYSISNNMDKRSIWLYLITDTIEWTRRAANGTSHATGLIQRDNHASRSCPTLYTHMLQD